MKTRYSPIAALMQVDSYKLDHRRAYLLSGSVTNVYSNYTNRKSRIPEIDHVVHFGLQAFLQEYCIDAFESFFAADEDLVAELYEERMMQVTGPNLIGTDHIRALHRKGYLPLKFCALPEGTPVPIKVPSFTVENTDPEFFWLTNYIESVLSASVWQASTSATLAHRLRKIFDKDALETSGQTASVDWQGHDFSFRGMSSPQTAEYSGAGHLLSFTGTDSLISLEWIDYFYPGENGLVGGSVPATEHSVMSTGIATISELELFRKLLTLYPTGIFSAVSDTFNLWDVLTKIAPALKDEIMARDGKIVFRPDSGNPADILCGLGSKDLSTIKRDKQIRESGRTPAPEDLGVIELLWDIFGGTINEQGYKELDSHVGAIYGDGMKPDVIIDINNRLKAKGFASTNWVAGVGSFYYQYNTRDTFSSAMKATSAVVDGERVNIFKNPVTDDGMKKSATGRLCVYKDADGDLKLIEKASLEQEKFSLLKPVWADGYFLKKQSFADVRKVLADSKF